MSQETLPSPSSESDLRFSDITTNNATTARHGLLKKLSGDPTEYMDGSGAWSVPAGSGGGTPVTDVTATAPVLSSGGTTPDISMPAASSVADGYMSAVSKAKLDGIATGATANSSDATLLDRANHTGTQAASTISDFSEAVDDRVSSLLVAGTGISITYDDALNTETIAATGGGGGGSLTVEEVDGSPTDSAVTKLIFPNGTLSITSHEATYTPAGGGGGGGSTSGIGAYSARPAAGTAGNLYIATDGASQWVDDGTNWRPILNGVVGTQPAAAASWTQLHFSSGGGLATLTDAAGALILKSGLNTGVFGQAISIAPGQTAPYTVIVHLTPHYPFQTSQTVGFGFGDSSAGTWQAWTWQNNGYAYYNWSNVGGASSSVVTSYLAQGGQIIPQWWKLQDDGTNRMWFASHDGLIWQKAGTVARTNYLSTPDRIVFYVDAQSSVLPATLLIRSFKSYSGLV